MTRTAKVDLSVDCRFMACMECGMGDKCGCSCHSIAGLEGIPKGPIIELLKILMERHWPCRHGSQLADCKIHDWMVRNQGLLRGLEPKKKKARK